ncbi:hypothetical protein [Agrobacterium tumefaciens]
MSTTLGANPYSGDVYTYHRQRTTRARAAALAGDRCRDPRLDRG